MVLNSSLQPTYCAIMRAECTEQPHESHTSQPFFKKVGECLYRYSNTGTYYALVKRGGKQFRKSLKTSDRQLAERKLADFRSKAGRLGNPTCDRGITFMELAQDWFDAAKTRLKPSSARGMEVCIKQLNKHFGTMAARNIGATDCHEWEKKRGARTSASTFNHDRTALIAVLDHAVQQGLLLENPGRTIARRKLIECAIVNTVTIFNNGHNECSTFGTGIQTPSVRTSTMGNASASRNRT